MSYQALARKWRPRDFGQMVGQAHVVRALMNGLNNDRLHHAFVFTGTRGVGKTTIARILAKCLNCEEGVSATPCGVCTPCRELDEGRFVDLIEVDAASRARVEETRELMDNVQFLPARGRYKVYLIDEVHMFSGHSFNALLKTLEEPPPHVKFLLATTDPKKLPVTVLSRCIQFNLKRLPVDEIAGQLAHILGKEGIPVEEGVTRLIARAADGSMRDALSLLDQGVSYCGGGLDLAEIKAMLGTVDQGHIHALLAALADGDGGALMARVAAVAGATADFDDALCELMSALQRMAMMQLIPGAADDPGLDGGGLNSGPDGGGDLEALAARISPEDTQLYYQIALMGRRDLPFAPDPRGGFEMIALRMLAFRPVSGAPDVSTHSAVSPAIPPAIPGAGRRPQPPPAPRAHPAGAPPLAPPLAPSAENWPGIVAGLPLTGMATELASHCGFVEYNNDTLRLCIAPSYAQVASANMKMKLESALRAYWKREVRLVVEQTAPEMQTPADIRQQQDEERQRAAARAIDEDPNVQALCTTFDAKIQAVTALDAPLP